MDIPDLKEIKGKRKIALAAVSLAVIGLFLHVSAPDTSANSDLREVTVSSKRFDFQYGKIQRGRAELDGNNLSLAKNAQSMKYWESPTFNFEKVQSLEVKADIPEGDSATVTLRSSPNPEFEKNGSYYARDEMSASLDDGSNVFNLGKRQDGEIGGYLRVHFSMSDGKESEEKPVITSYSLEGLRDPNKLLVAYGY